MIWGIKNKDSNTKNSFLQLPSSGIPDNPTLTKVSGMTEDDFNHSRKLIKNPDMSLIGISLSKNIHNINILLKT